MILKDCFHQVVNCRACFNNTWLSNVHNNINNFDRVTNRITKRAKREREPFRVSVIIIISIIIIII